MVSIGRTSGKSTDLDVTSHTVLNGGRNELGVEKKLVDLHGHDEESGRWEYRCKE